MIDYNLFLLYICYAQGIIKEDKVNSFNIPIYYPSQNELKLEVFNEGSFAINQAEMFEINFTPLHDCNDFDFESKKSQSLHNGYNFMRSMRAVFEPLIVSHFGEAIVEEVFSRYQEILVDRIMSNVKIKSYNFTISLTRKAY
jgi:jasmonate O-methyltransferase